MAVKSYPLENGERVAAREVGNWRKLAAAGVQVLSYLTTLWAVQWVWAEGALSAQVGVALVLEAILVIMKACLFNGRSAGVGWIGIGVDALINAGGILPRAGRVLTFPPIAAVLGFFSVTAAEPTTNAIGAFLIALISGILLSVLPHRLWRD